MSCCWQSLPTQWPTRAPAGRSPPASCPIRLPGCDFYITTVIADLEDEVGEGGTARFVVSTHWRLHRIFPAELAEAEKPFVDLLLTEITAATKAGLLAPPNPEWDAWFIIELVRAVYFYYAYAPREADAQERLWDFCLAALGGHQH